MPFTTFSTSRSGRSSNCSPNVCLRSPPGWPVCRYESFCSRLFPVRPTLSALTTMTKSPVSRCGAYVGLCLPRSNVATSVASLPSTTFSASITCQERVISPGFGVYVGKGLPRQGVACGSIQVLCWPGPQGHIQRHIHAPQRTTGSQDTLLPTGHAKRGPLVHLIRANSAVDHSVRHSRQSRSAPVPQHIRPPRGSQRQRARRKNIHRARCRYSCSGSAAEEATDLLVGLLVAVGDLRQCRGNTVQEAVEVSQALVPLPLCLVPHLTRLTAPALGQRLHLLHKIVEMVVELLAGVLAVLSSLLNDRILYNCFCHGNAPLRLK